jgi:uncharacterized protein (DUF1684 family)
MLLAHALVTFAALWMLGRPPDEPAAAWAADLAQWRHAREVELAKEDGWLSVAGLFFLRPGDNSVGADPGADVVLPIGSAPARAGRLVHGAHGTRFEPAPGVMATIDGRRVTTAVTLSLADAAAQRPAERLAIGRVTLHLHRSGDRLGVRLRDPESPHRRGFTGLRWFDADPAWRLRGRFVPYDAPREIPIQNVLGDLEPMRSPGQVEVAIDGARVRVVALQASRGRLWLIFSDATAGAQTYRTRFLYTDAPGADGGVTVDFNRAYNPPCAFNPHTTCPLPPRQNRLAVAVTAGEQRYADHLRTSNDD